MDRIERLHPRVVVLAQQGADETAVAGVIEVEAHVVLAAVDDVDQNLALVGSPGDSGEVSLGSEVPDVQGAQDMPEGVADAEVNLLRRHAVHGIAYALEAACAGIYVQQGELAHGAFVHPEHCQEVTIGRGEPALGESELVARRDHAIADGRVVRRRQDGDDGTGWSVEGTGGS